MQQVNGATSSTVTNPWLRQEAKDREVALNLEAQVGPGHFGFGLWLN